MNGEKLREVQLIQVEILKETVRICNKNKLKYFLIGGTLIGAIRHKGFIPWDDDIDIAMPRKDYDKFIEIAQRELKSKYRVVHYTTDDSYTKYLLNIVDTTVSVIIKNVNPIVSNVWIDILPIDGLPNNRFMRCLYKLRVLYYRCLAGFVNIDILFAKKRSLMEKILILFGKTFHIGKLLNLKKIREKNDKLLRKYDYANSNLVGTFYGRYGFHEVVPKEYFGKSSRVEFENMKFNAPEKVHEYLTHMYGDYMELPPEEKREIPHIMDIKRN